MPNPIYLKLSVSSLPVLNVSLRLFQCHFQNQLLLPTENHQHGHKLFPEALCHSASKILLGPQLPFCPCFATENSSHGHTTSVMHQQGHTHIFLTSMSCLCLLLLVDTDKPLYQVLLLVKGCFNINCV